MGNMIVYLQNMVIIGGGMNLFVYYESYQEKQFSKILCEIPEATPIVNEKHLDSIHLEDQYSILILLSQPDHKMQRKLTKFRWCGVISHIGIRIDESIKTHVNFFENEHDFKMLMDQALLKQRKSMVEFYINQLTNIDDKDLNYLERITGERIIKNHMKKRESFIKKKSQMFGLVTIVGNSEVAASLSQSIAEKASKRALVIDGNLLKPSLDSYYKKNNIRTPIQSHLSGIDNTGINIALDSIAKGVSLEVVLPKIVQRVNKNLDVLLGNYNVYNYEHYGDENINKLIGKICEIYSLVFLIVPENPYDCLTMIGLHQSKFNIFICRESSPEIRYFSNIIQILDEKQCISKSKQLVVTYISDDKHSKIGVGAISAIFKSMYVGRYNFRNMFKYPKSSVDKIVERIRL